MKKKQRTALYKQIGVYASEKLRIERFENETLYKEICKDAGIAQNRLSEIVSKKTINDKGLVALIAGGIIQVDAMIKDLQLKGEEADYLRETFQIHEDKALKHFYVKLKDRGIDPAMILKRALERVEAKDQGQDKKPE